MSDITDIKADVDAHLCWFVNEYSPSTAVACAAVAALAAETWLQPVMGGGGLTPCDRITATTDFTHTPRIRFPSDGTCIVAVFLYIL